MSKATSVAEYLEALPGDRRAVVSAVRAVIRQQLPKGYEEVDMGKSCIRVKRAEDLPLAVIGKRVAAIPVDDFITGYERSRKQ